jgi:hypothetical protein
VKRLLAYPVSKENDDSPRVSDLDEETRQAEIKMSGKISTDRSLR